MKQGNSAARTIVLYNILKKETDHDHHLSATELLSEMEARGFACDRRTLYDSIHALQTQGYPVCYVRKGRQAYYLEPDFSPAEVLFLLDAVRTSPALSVKETERMDRKIQNVFGESLPRHMHLMPETAVKTDNDEVLENIGILLKAIARLCTVTFYYYDLNPDRSRAYRREHRVYRLVPYAITANNGRYYCVFYDAGHQDFSSYRVDKMEALTLTDEVNDPHPFDLESWLRASFNMYKGTAETITCVFDRSMLSIVFDQFGKDIIISASDDRTFTASIRTSVTPTLTSWLLQFYDRVTVLKPVSLINEMQNIAAVLDRKYNGGK